jgi:hypothetical protein
MPQRICWNVHESVTPWSMNPAYVSGGANRSHQLNSNYHAFLTKYEAGSEAKMIRGWTLQSKSPDKIRGDVMMVTWSSWRRWSQRLLPEPEQLRGRGHYLRNRKLTIVEQLFSEWLSSPSNTLRTIKLKWGSVICGETVGWHAKPNCF